MRKRECWKRGKMEDVEMTIRVFTSFAEADEEDAKADLRMTPEERIAMVLELQSRVYPDASKQGFARIYRATELKRG